MLGIALQFSPVAQLIDLKLLDLGFAVLREVAPKPAAENPVLIAADEATLEAFPEPIALWHRYLGDIFSGLAAARPRAVGVDIELPPRSQDELQPGLDYALAQGIQALKTVTPFVIARGMDDAGRIKPVHVPFLALAGEDGSGLATWPLDRDNVVRRFDERQGADGTAVPTFVGVLVRRLGRQPGPGVIDFGLGAPYDYVPAHEVWKWVRAKDEARMRREFGGRIVLVGGVFPFTDRHQQPVNLAGWETDMLAAPGLLLHAQALRSLLGPGLIRPAPTAVVLSSVVVAAALWFSFVRIGIGLALMLLLSAAMIGTALWSLHTGVHLPIAGALLTALCTGGSRIAYESWFNGRERRRLRAAFEGYVSPNVMDLIVRGELGSAVGTGRRNVCVLFADIRDFTRLSERTPPEQVVSLLNRYFERMTGAIHRHDGTVDNFRGDGIMCFFGAPRQTDDPCRDGFLAATDMLAELGVLNAELTREGQAPLAMGIALAYGETVVGPIGAANRYVYTAIGDVANISARLEGVTREVHYPLVVTSAVAAALKGIAQFDDLGDCPLKGHAPVRACGWPPRSSLTEARAS